jgi:hypothetical protein
MVADVLVYAFPRGSQGRGRDALRGEYLRGLGLARRLRHVRAARDCEASRNCSRAACAGEVG